MVEYTGDIISMEEAAMREQDYARDGKPCTLMVINSGGHEIA